MAEYSRLASGQVVSTGGNTAVVIPFIPNYIAIENATRLVAGAGVTSASWMTDMGQGAAVLSTFGTGAQFIAPVGGSSSAGLTSGTGFSTFQGGIALQFGPLYSFASASETFSISKASPAVVTTSVAHGLVSGNVVVFQNLYQTATTGMQQIAGIPFVVTVTSPTAFTINYNTNQSNFTAFNSSTATNNAGSWMQVLYPNLYCPGIAFVDAVTPGATTTVVTTAPHNFSVGQEIAFRIPTSWGSTQLNSLPNVLIPGSPNYAFVVSVTNSTTFVCSFNSTAFSAFNSNQLFAAAAAGGFTFPQVVAVGDANSGSLLTNFLPPSFFNGTGTAAVATINGPAIAGAFCNNTSMGFIIGAGVAGTAADVIYWRAYLHDINL